MQPSPQQVNEDSYAKCIEVSKRVRWDIDKDVLRGRSFDFSQKFLPDGLTKIDEFDFLSDDDQRFVSQIQGRTYVNMFGIPEDAGGSCNIRSTGATGQGIGDTQLISLSKRVTETEEVCYEKACDIHGNGCNGRLFFLISGRIFH